MRKPEVFSDSDIVILRRGEQLVPVDVPISPDGGYIGNGQFKSNAKKKSFPTIIGFDKTGEQEIWFARGRVKVSKHPCG